MDFTQYIQSELLILVPVLYVLGMWIKGTSWIKNQYIPLVLAGMGIVLTLLWSFANTPLSDANIPLMVFTGIVEGVLEAAAAVYANQVYKQMKSSDDTTDENGIG